MPDRATIKLHITAAPLYKRRISSAYALSDFDSTITLGERGQLHLIVKPFVQMLLHNQNSIYYCNSTATEILQYRQTVS